MRNILVALSLAVLGVLAMPSDPASATTRGPYICYEQTDGTTACADLPANYHIDGVKRPFCDREHACNTGTVDFKLTDQNIADLKAYVSVKTMRPYHLATIYDARWIEHRHHHHHHHHHHHDRCGPDRDGCAPEHDRCG